MMVKRFEQVKCSVAKMVNLLRTVAWSLLFFLVNSQLMLVPNFSWMD